MVRFKPLLQAAAGASSLLYTLACFVPWTPPKSYGPIEDSWMLALHAAFHDRLQFGSDVVFPFGPWGFLYGGYHPTTHALSALVWSLLAVVFWIAAWDAARRLFGDGPVSWLWLMALIAVTDTTLFLNIDVRLTAFVLLLLLRHFFVDGPAQRALDAALVVALGLVSLIKFSLLVYVAVVVSMIALDLLVRQRRFPWPVPVYAVSVLAFWLLAGQRLGSIGPFVLNSLRVSGAYTESMMLTGPTELHDVVLFLAAAGLLAVLAGLAAWRKHGSLGVPFFLGWSFSLFTAFKYGYVRHDGHEVAAVLMLLVMSLLCLALLWPEPRLRGWRSVLSVLLVPSAVGVFAATTYARHAESGWWSTPSRHGTLREAYEKLLAKVRDDLPLPPIAGTTDVYPWNKALVFAYGLPLRSRPVIQSYCTFTPELEELNAAFLRGAGAPENVIFQVDTVDDRYPSLDDGRSWPELMTRYDLVDVEDSFLLMKRAATPREFHLTPIRVLPLAFGERLDVPAGPVWAEIELSRTVVGSIVSALYKPAELWLNVSLRDGRQLTKRLVPGMAKSGFLLSPFVQDNASFAALAAEEPEALADNEVTALSISGAGGYRSPMSLRLFRLDYHGQDVRGVKGYSRLAHFRRALRNAEALRGDPPPQVVYLPEAGTVLTVPRDSAVLIRPPARARRLRLQFAGDGVIFQLSFVDAQGQSVPVWSQRVDDRDLHESTVDLSKAGAALALETLPAGDGTAGAVTAYWSEIEFLEN